MLWRAVTWPQHRRLAPIRDPRSRAQQGLPLREVLVRILRKPQTPGEPHREASQAWKDLADEIVIWHQSEIFCRGLAPTPGSTPHASGLVHREPRQSKELRELAAEDHPQKTVTNVDHAEAWTARPLRIGGDAWTFRGPDVAGAGEVDLHSSKAFGRTKVHTRGISKSQVATSGVHNQPQLPIFLLHEEDGASLPAGRAPVDEPPPIEVGQQLLVFPAALPQNRVHVGLHKNAAVEGVVFGLRSHHRVTICIQIVPRLVAAELPEKRCVSHIVGQRDVCKPVASDGRAHVSAAVIRSALRHGPQHLLAWLGYARPAAPTDSSLGQLFDLKLRARHASPPWSALSTRHPIEATDDVIDASMHCRLGVDPLPRAAAHVRAACGRRRPGHRKDVVLPNCIRMARTIAWEEAPRSGRHRRRCQRGPPTLSVVGRREKHHKEKPPP